MKISHLFIRIFTTIFTIASLFLLVSGLDSEPATIQLHPDDYAIFAFDHIQIGQKSKILSGSIGVNRSDSSSEIILDQKAEIPTGFYVKADRVQIRQKALVQGDVHANDLNNKGTINGQVVASLTLPLFINLPEFISASPGQENFHVKTNQTLTLEPGAYKNLIVQNKGIVYLSGGDYHFETIELEANTQLVFQDNSHVNLFNQITSKNDVFIGPDLQSSMLNASNIVFHVSGNVDLGQNNIIRASVYAPQHQISIGRHSECTGAFWAMDVLVGEDVTLMSEIILRKIEKTDNQYIKTPVRNPKNHLYFVKDLNIFQKLSNYLSHNQYAS